MIALDLSRLLSRARSATPSGIDRVELAYAQHLLARAGPHCFTALDALGRIGMLPRAEAELFVGMLAAAWRDGAAPETRREIATLARRLRRAALFGGERRLRAAISDGGAPVYVLVSHHHLDRSRAIARLKAATGARFACFVHDLIPLDFPRYTRPSQTHRHRRRIATTAALADAVIVNSAATRAALQRRLDPERPVPIAVAPLGFELPEMPEAAAGERPYFICIGTIEARKNHGLLLDLWQSLAAELGERAPRLLLIGQRGWGSERIAGRLATMPGLVAEHRDMPDRQMASLLRGARALLLPSLAQGFGLPVIEALALGVPVICSGLPALRESGGEAPDYLDPSDAAAWRAVILDYRGDTSRRQAQLGRLPAWRKPRWEDHFAIVDRVIAGLASARPAEMAEDGGKIERRGG